MTHIEFLERAKSIHGDKYKYIDTYVRSVNHIKIECPKHGVFEQKPVCHLQGRGCRECGLELISKKSRSNKIEFVKKAKNIHGDKYRYIGEYKTIYDEIEIKCPKHGSFFKKPILIIQGHGCNKCTIEAQVKRQRKTHEQFLSDARKIHGDKYKYLTKYTRVKDKIKIECPYHGVFEQTPGSHLAGRGCNECGRIRTAEARKMEHSGFVQRANKVHEGKYEYLSKYQNAFKKVKIKCKVRNHGVFTQAPYSHLNGHGCPKCRESFGEAEVRKCLDLLGFKYIYQKAIRPKGSKWYQYIDFYIPICNTAIEYHGKQHYEPIDYFGGKVMHKDTVRRDKVKANYCEKNGIKLIVIPYHKKENVLSILMNEIGTNKGFDFSGISIPKIGIQKTLF